MWRSHHDGQSLAQRWFAGLHSNVGGGYVDDGLANVAFHWILDEATQRGLKVDRGFAAADPTANLSLSPSVIYRIQAEPEERDKEGDLRFPELRQRYRPPNVLLFLACQPNLDRYLEDLGLEEQDRRLPQDVMRRIAELRKNCRPEIEES